MQSVSGGYTIVETMIVLAVTGVLFASAVLLFQGQQGRSQFNDSMRDIQSKLQDWANDVSTGYYPAAAVAGGGSGYTCSFSAGGSRVTHLALASPGVKANGTNAPCIYLGKVIQFTPGSNFVKAYTIIGQRTVNFSDPSTDLVQSLAQAGPVIARDTSTHLDLTENYEIRWGSEAQAIPLPPASPTSTYPTYTMAIYNSFGSTANDTGTSSNAVTMYQLPNINFADEDALDSCVQGISPPSGCGNDAASLLSRGASAFKEWKICFKSATSNQFASVSFGLSGGSFNSVVTYPRDCN